MVELNLLDAGSCFGDGWSMSHERFLRCPHCDAEIRRRIQDKGRVRCAGCGRDYAAMAEESTGKTGLVDVSDRKMPEPLYLPRGSVRAFATLFLSACTWILVVRRYDVPGYLLSLLLAMVGYYFGFRHKAKAADSRIYDAAAHVSEPLFLPAGFVRFVLGAGFVFAGGVLFVQGAFANPKYLEFYVVLTGLMGGHIFGRLLRGLRENVVAAALNHLKAGVVILCAVCLGILVLTGAYLQHPTLSLTLAALTSFYFGSRS